MDRGHARRELVRSLELAYSGELGAIHAYLGHRVSVSDPEHRQIITDILKDEVRHRRCVLGMLEALGGAPDPTCERKMRRVGKTISCLCFTTGWFIPMYGAARLEADNIVEYELAARLAWHADEREHVDGLLEMAEVEWDHELALRTLAASHWLWKVAPKWRVPPPRESIRESFEAFTESPVPVERRKSMLMR